MTEKGEDTLDVQNDETGIVSSHDAAREAGLSLGVDLCQGATNAFEERVGDWAIHTFGEDIALNLRTRASRFLEEALELAQVLGLEPDKAKGIVDYVYGRPIGELNQEVGGVMVTLGALCAAAKVDMILQAETELTRCWKNVEKIRAKSALKPH